MKYILLALFLSLASCSNVYEKEKELIKTAISSEFNSVSLEPEFLYISYTDTVMVADIVNGLAELPVIGVKDLTKDALLEMRGQEQRLRSDPEYYEKVIFSNECDSEWCNKLRTQLSLTDTILNGLIDNDPLHPSIRKNAAFYSWRGRQYFSRMESAMYYDSIFKLSEHIESVYKKQNIWYYVLSCEIEITNPLDRSKRMTIQRDYKINPLSFNIIN